MLKPLRGYVLILPDKAEEKTKSGLYLPETSQEKPIRGQVVAVGDEENKNLLKSVVYYKKWSGDEIEHDGTKYRIVKFEDVVAVVT